MDTAPTTQPQTEGRRSGVLLLLRLEAALPLAGAVALYRASAGSWWLFAILFLVPDASMLGYLRNPKTGAFIYNAAHTYLAPAALALVGIAAGLPILQPVALIWVAHIGFDRMLGYGLKYPTRFGDTHLGVVGQQARRGPV